MFSQNEEEIYILRYFKDYVGTFCSLGESDGQTFSNVRALALRGWKGVMVEPIPEAFEKLKALYKTYKGLYSYNYAISDCNCTKIIRKNINGVVAGDSGLLSTFHQNGVDRFKRITDFEAIPVRAHHWKTAINKWKIKQFDMFSIDIEDDEMFVLPDIDLSYTKLIVIEHNGSAEKKTAYLECTSKYGIDKIIYESGENLIITR